MTFKEYHFKSYINEALNSINFVNPTKVQEIVIPEAISGTSLMVESATGSGKTHAFLLPILENLDEDNKSVQTIILSPTRELAMQLYNVCVELTKHSKKEITVARAIGGVDRESEIKKYEKSQPQIVIGTIGRIVDLAIKTNVLKIHLANTVVIDEADMIFEEKELIEVDKIMGKIQGKPQFLIFSATIPKGLRHFLRKYLENVNNKYKNFTTLDNKHIRFEAVGLIKPKVDYVNLPNFIANKKDLKLSNIDFNGRQIAYSNENVDYEITEGRDIKSMLEGLVCCYNNINIGEKVGEVTIVGKYRLKSGFNENYKN